MAVELKGEVMATGSMGTGESKEQCPSCGMERQPGMSFCSGCGTALTSFSGQTTQTSLVDQPVAVAPGSPSSVNPTPPHAPPPPYPSTYQQYQQPGMTVVHQTMVGPSNNGLCIAAMVLGIIALVLFWAPFFGIALGVLATIFGAVGIPSSTKKGQAGKGMGIAGLIMGIIALAINLIFIISVWSFFASNSY